jgi:hypothetical protein
MKLHYPRTALWVLGLASVFPYLFTVWLKDLRTHTVEFLIFYGLAFLVYAGATMLAISAQVIQRRELGAIFAFAIIVQGLLIFTRPTLSDDMYRYIWDGRVQAQGISPYQYAPNAPELAYLRDEDIYPDINRKPAVTIYPPAAEVAFALLWRIWPDNIRWFQIATATSSLLAGVLLVGLLRDLGRPDARLLIYLWSPLLAFETAHAAHVDGLVLPFLVGAWWARVRQRDGLLGFLLGVATAMKLYPILLLPILWRSRHRQGRIRMPLTFGITVGLFYLPYTLASGKEVLGYLPRYIWEKFNVSPLVSNLDNFFNLLGLDQTNWLLILTFLVLVMIYCWVIIKPALNAETALRRCIWPVGVITLLSRNLFSWYLLWLLPLVAIFLQPSGKFWGRLPLPRVNAWTGWWLFCGLIGLSYTFFIQSETVETAILLQFIPLYTFVLIDLFRFFKGLFRSSR